MDRFLAVKTGAKDYCDFPLSPNKKLNIGLHNCEFVDTSSGKIDTFNLSFYELHLFLDYQYEIGAMLKTLERITRNDKYDLQHFNGLASLWGSPRKEALWRRFKQQLLISKRKTNAYSIRLSETKSIEIANVTGEVTCHLYDGQNYLGFSEEELLKLWYYEGRICDCLLTILE